jgi:hypothetical protein
VEIKYLLWLTRSQRSSHGSDAVPSVYRMLSSPSPLVRLDASRSSSSSSLPVTSRKDCGCHTPWDTPIALIHSDPPISFLALQPSHNSPHTYSSVPPDEGKKYPSSGSWKSSIKISLRYGTCILFVTVLIMYIIYFYIYYWWRWSTYWDRFMWKKK